MNASVKVNCSSFADPSIDTTTIPINLSIYLSIVWEKGTLKLVTLFIKFAFDTLPPIITQNEFSQCLCKTKPINAL
jgi:hypothetical protein